MSKTYSRPVSQLQTLGDPRPSREWCDYTTLGLTPTDAPDLIRILQDESFEYADPDSPLVWARLHAWRAVAQLELEEAIPALLELLDWAEEDDWVQEEVPKVLGRLGPAILLPITAYLAAEGNNVWARTTAASALVELVKRRPELRDQCIEILVHALRRRKSQSPILNATLIGDLIDLKAVEVIGEIRAAFLDGVVDLTFNGDFQEVEIEMGLRTRRTGPPRWSFEFSSAAEGTGAPTPTEADFRRAGRNDLCPCGSGIKFKKCCLNRTARPS